MLRTRALTLPNTSPRGASSSALRRAHKIAGLPHAQRILGVDPGLHFTGYGVIEVGSGRIPALIEGGVLKAKATEELPKRLLDLHEGLCEVIAETSPDIVVVEDLFSTYQHPRSALLMAHARGVLLLAAEKAGISVYSFLPNEIKMVVAGNGHATKTSMQSAVRARLNLSAPLHPPDVADALAIAICFALRQDAAGKLG